MSLVYKFPLWWLREYTLWLIIIIKSEVWTIIHCLGLGHETVVCAVCLSIFFWDWAYYNRTLWCRVEILNWDIIQVSFRLCNWLSFVCFFRALITCLLYVVGPLSGNLVWNDCRFVKLFHCINYVFTHTLKPHNMVIFYFRLPYLLVSLRV